MNNNFKRTFFSSLLAVLVLVSNLIGIKYTNFNGLILSVNFVTLPFIFLCILLLNNICNKKEASSAILSAVFIQVFILLSYVLVTNLGTQAVIPDYANSINEVFMVNELYIIINLVALFVSSFVLQYIYEYFRIIGYKLLGTVISLLASIILYGLIAIPVINYGFGVEIILNIILCHIIMSSIMTILITVLYYLLKDKEYPYDENKIFIQNVKIDVPKEKQDKSIEEVIKIVDKNASKAKPKKRKVKYVDRKVNKSKKITKK